MGRPSLPPGRYFRLLLLGYFEGLDSERGIAWRAADSLAVRSFLGLGLDDAGPGSFDDLAHAAVDRRGDPSGGVHVGAGAPGRRPGCSRGKTVAIDATTLEANAAMRSIVRRDTGESYQEFLTRLAAASGIKTPTREALARLDRRRKKRTSNEDWKNPSDPDAKITKMKDGRTHLAHKAEHAVDLETGALVAVTLQGADVGDTTSLLETRHRGRGTGRGRARASATAGGADRDRRRQGLSQQPDDDRPRGGRRAVLHRRARSRPPATGRRRRRRSDPVYGNRRRVRGARGKRLMRRRGEYVERSFAHVYDTGGLRRTHLRGHPNILKRLLVHAGAFNLGLLMRQAFGRGTPRGLQGRPVRPRRT